MTGPTYDRPTYPGIIPYRTNSPSSQAPALLTDGPRLLSVAKRSSMSTVDLYKDSYNTLPANNTSENNQFYLQNGKHRGSMAAITSTSLYATEKRYNNSNNNGSKESLKKVYTEKDLRASLENYTLTEDEVRDKYYAYWEQQRVRHQSIFIIIVS